jgi:bifunctional non-homologous end joining protein LigD
MPRPKPQPAAYITPMKALGVEAIPPTGTWHCEIKWDGYRALAVINQGKVKLWSRNQKPLVYPEVLPPLQSLKCKNAVIDGEIVALAPSGHSNFQALQQRDLGKRPPIAFYVFDLLHLDGESCLNLPIEGRRKLLSSLVGHTKSTVRLSPVYDVDPHALFAEAKKKGLEGIILKQAGSLYEPDRRSGTWLKVKNVNEQEFVIGGFTPPKNSRESFGAILIGYFEKGKLVYAGKVGTGFDVELLRSLHAKFLRLRTDKSPFAELPRGDRSRPGMGLTQAVLRTVTWLKPTLVAQIRFTEWTVEGNLRHPVFLGLRKDKSAQAVRREAPAASVN